MSDVNNINWYPGHMAKANREIEEQLKLVDIVIELRDARIPISSRNPLLDELCVNKKKLIILNKADKADSDENNKWVSSFDNVLLINSLNDRSQNIVITKVKELLKEKLDKAKLRGIRNKTLRAMVVGIPNVGKSTFINNVANKKITKTENKPGVTKKVQWIQINKDLELLDTPGVLWPKIETKKQGILLGLIGSINDDVLDFKELSDYSVSYIKDNYPGLLNKRYGIDEEKNDLIDDIARAKGCIKSNNEIDYSKTYNMIIFDIRNNKLGKISFEKYESN